MQCHRLMLERGSRLSLVVAEATSDTQSRRFAFEEIGAVRGADFHLDAPLSGGRCDVY